MNAHARPHRDTQFIGLGWELALHIVSKVSQVILVRIQNSSLGAGLSLNLCYFTLLFHTAR